MRKLTPRRWWLATLRKAWTNVTDAAAQHADAARQAQACPLHAAQPPAEPTRTGPADGT